MKAQTRKTNKHKIIARTSFNQRLKGVALAEKDRSLFNQTCQSRQNLHNWKKQKEVICKLPAQVCRSKNYLLTDETDSRKTGLFPVEQEKLVQLIKKRRMEGEPVSTIWARTKMRHLCKADKPAGYDPEKHKFTEHWCTNFLDRKGLSVRCKTNVKKSFIFQRLHKKDNYTWYCVYKLADDPISSESESSSGEDEEEEEVSTDNESENIITSGSESE